MVSGGNDSMVKVWSISSGQTGAELKLIHSINVSVKARFSIYIHLVSEKVKSKTAKNR